MNGEEPLRRVSFLKMSTKMSVMSTGRKARNAAFMRASGDSPGVQVSLPLLRTSPKVLILSGFSDFSFYPEKGGEQTGEQCQIINMDKRKEIWYRFNCFIY